MGHRVSPRSVLGRTTALWHCVHLHSGGDIFSRRFDEHVVELLERLHGDSSWDAAVHALFFVRYEEGGAHLRLRVRSRHGHDPQHLGDRLTTHLSALRQRGHDWRPIWTDYVPEVDRYGGPKLLPIAERAFCASSRTAATMLAQSVTVPARRCHVEALLSMMATAWIVAGSCEAAATFLENFADGCARRFIPAGKLQSWRVATVDALWADVQSCRMPAEVLHRAVRHTAVLDGPLGYHVQTLQHTASQLARAATDSAGTPPSARRLQQILRSLMHMHTNRLGISNASEAQLAAVGGALIREVGS